MIRKMSKELRLDLEYVYASLVVDHPYCSPDAESRLKKILGYAVNAEGERLEEE